MFGIRSLGSLIASAVASGLATMAGIEKRGVFDRLLPRNITPARPPAKYHRVADAQRALARFKRWVNQTDQVHVGVELAPRHIRENYTMARDQLKAMGIT